MVRLLSTLAMAAAVLAACAHGDGAGDDELRKKPITTDTGEVGKLLKKWYAEGSAAGNVGDWYDNRDGEHSPLDLRPYPQLRKVQYTPEDIKRRRHWALQPRTLPHVVFGNSSTSAPPHLTGSNPRTYYCAPDGLKILESHYLHNNLYIYPEHRDHDPGHNGIGDGYGDLYPTNTPYLIISQGSSGSDQPFMRALPFTLAAFRPEVKKKLVEKGLLMPTVQMILRASNRHLAHPREYLTGKAHPTVFEGSWVDPLKMAKLAHDIRPDSIPPLVKLRVREEDEPEAGRDFFEPAGLSERLGDSVSVIARVWRGAAYRRRLVVSAEGSLDVNDKALTFTWVVLRGDEKRIAIKPRNKAGSVVEITVAYHERRPVAPGSALESNRVDIGVFAHNGVHYSAPGFVTFFSLDSEGRTYDDKGRIAEIGYGMGENDLNLVQVEKLLAALGKDDLPARVLGLTAAQRGELAKAAGEVGPAAAEVEQLRKKRREAETGNKATLKERQEALSRAEKAFNELLDRRRPALEAGARPFVLGRLRRALRMPELWNDHVKALSTTHRARVDEARRKLVQMGVIEEGKERLTFRRETPTLHVRSLLEEFNAVVLSELVLPGLVRPVFRTNFVDARLTAVKSWRDVYRHDGDRLAGWTRYRAGQRPQEFTPEGWLVLEKDTKGRPIKARTVVYQQAPAKGMVWVNPNPLRQSGGDELITLEYPSGRRKVKSREKVFEAK
jgi:hypothetical protein